MSHLITTQEMRADGIQTDKLYGVFFKFIYLDLDRYLNNK